MRVTLFTASLRAGGAERQLTLLAKGLSARGHEVVVVTLFGAFESNLNGGGLTVTPLYAVRRSNVFSRMLQLALSPFRLRGILDSCDPDVVYSMLHLANLIAWFATRGRFAARLVWGNRSSRVRANWKHQILEFACARLSTSVPLLIANSYAGLEHTLARRFQARTVMVIDNGIDTRAFSPAPHAALEFRKALQVGEHTPLVGIVARVDPMKDYATFLRAAKLVLDSRPECRFLCVGGERRQSYLRSMRELSERLGISPQVYWLGNREDLAAVYTALNVVVCSSSCGEGFPNAIGEAMACGTLCVTTNVGDAARLVGSLGGIARVGDHSAIAAEVCRLLDMAGEGAGLEARARVLEKFSHTRLVTETERALLSEVVAMRRAREGQRDT